MHATSLLLFLGFLFISLLSIAEAYPRPQGLIVRVVPNTAGTQRINHQTNANTSRRKDQKKKNKERESLDEDEQQDSDPEPPETGDDNSDIDNVEDGGSLKCSNPLTQQFAGQFEDGHGCKKIAEAFNRCGSSSTFFCTDTSAQKNCLCNQSGDFDDQVLRRCYNFLVEKHPRAAQRLELYEGICGF